MSTTHYDSVYDLILRIKNKTDYECQVAQNTMGINNCQSTIVDEPVYELPFYTEEHNSTVATLGESSQVEC